MGRVKKLFCVLLCLLVVGSLVLSSIKLREDDLADRKRLWDISRQYDEEFLPLKEQQKELKSELERLEEQYLSGCNQRGMIILLCTAPDARIMTDIAPVLQNYSFPGVIAVGENAMPNDSGCLTAEEMAGLMSLGWEICYLMKEDTDLQSIDERLQLMGLPLPKCAYFPNGNCNSIWEDALQERSVQSVIQYRKTYGSECAEELFHISAMGSFESGVKDDCLNAVSTKDVIAVTVGYEESREIYLADNFSKMLTVLETVADGEQASVCTVSDAYEENSIIQGVAGKEYRQYQEQKTALEKKLADVEREMQTIQSEATDP